jgi:hypothetical protein
VIGPLPAVAPNDDLAFVLQFAAVGSVIVGTIVAARQRRRDPTADAWSTTARWTVAGAVAGVLAAIVARVL